MKAIIQAGASGVSGGGLATGADAGRWDGCQGACEFYRLTNMADMTGSSAVQDRTQWLGLLLSAACLRRAETTDPALDLGYVFRSESGGIGEAARMGDDLHFLPHLQRIIGNPGRFVGWVETGKKSGVRRGHSCRALSGTALHRLDASETEHEPTG